MNLLDNNMTNNKNEILDRNLPSPDLINRKVGMALTEYRAAVSGFSSTSIFKNTTSLISLLSSLNFWVSSSPSFYSNKVGE